MKFASIFKNRSIASWKWVPQLRIISFQSKSILKNVKYSIFSDTAKFVSMLDSSWSQSALYLPTTTMAGGDVGYEAEDSVLVEKTAIEEALRSKRMSFDPGNTSSSILLDLDDNDNDDDDYSDEFCYQECEMIAVETEDPYGDFRVSMEEMVEAYESKAYSRKNLDLDLNWEYLEELLACYLKVNDKKNHGFIVGAFIDMFIGFVSSRSSCSCVYGSSSKCWCKGKYPKYN